MSDLRCTLTELFVHPVKSCAGIALTEAQMVETGLDLDRIWVVADEAGEMLTQRVLPRMALIRPTIKTSEVVLRAPGMLTLHLRLDAAEAPTRVSIWGDILKACDMGDLAAQWFSDFLGQRARLLRFDPDQQRLADPAWAGEVAAESAFADAFPLLVANSASLADLNERLAARGQAAVTMQRFRPNVVLSGLQPWDEDHIDEIMIETAEGPVRLRLVKPCVRCSVPNVDPATGESASEPGDTLAGFRADPRMDGGITFGVNAVVVEGIERWLRVGQAATASWKFD